MKKNAFTLAEVLITLTIIGVIAALTIPNLVVKSGAADSYVYGYGEEPDKDILEILGIEDKEAKTFGFYHCPVYYTTARGGTYIFTAYLRMETEETDPNIWIMAGVALILSTDE